MIQLTSPPALVNIVATMLIRVSVIGTFNVMKNIEVIKYKNSTEEDKNEKTIKKQKRIWCSNGFSTLLPVA